jgi:glycosyltransferase involved in cell wall biosynthesis
VRKNIAQIPSSSNQNTFVFVLPFSEIGGTELQTVNLAREFMNNGYGVEICLLSIPGPLVKVLESKKIIYRHFEINNTSLYQKSINMFRFAMYLSQEKFTHIYSLLPHAIVYSYICKGINRKAKFISGIRGKLQKKSLILEYILGVILRKSQFVIFNSQSIRDEISQKYRLDSNKSLIIHNGVANFVSKKKISSDKDTKQAIVISNFHSYKNYDQLIEMIKEVKYPCNYIFCGNGNEFYIDRIIQKITETGLNERIKLVINSHDLMNPLYGSDFAIHPSTMESLSNAILEEMSAGLPVVAFNVGGNSELIEDGKNGFLVNLGDKKEFISRIDFLIENTIERTKMGIQSIEKSQNFSFEKCFKKHLEIMKL